MKTLALIIMVAVVLEALVEYAKTVADMIEEKEYKTAVTQAVTIALGIGLAFAFKLELFNGAMSEFYEGLSVNPVLDMILTGILFSRGSNYFSDLISRLTRKDNTAAQLIAIAEDGYMDFDEDDFIDDEEEGDEDDGTPDDSEA